ncbi:hypothetical protein AB0F71_35280 [Kitasatospora sp. NPDC028055]|uniref:hypothetical protein n=1 Tax=Kitasatospora sp. NPDC028055 TaxID=3155653 RepID=UPI003403F1EE
MLVYVVLALGYLLPPLVCWAFLVRTRAVGAAVLAVLAAPALALVGLEQEWYFTRATAEIEAGYPLAAGLVVLAGALVERRLRGPRPERQFYHPVAGAAVALTVHALVGAAVAVAYPLFAHDAFLPSAAEVPVPAGLTVTRTDGGYCGSDFCARTLTIGSTTGLPAAELEARMRAALTADGWTAGRDGALLRPHGWLLDRRLSTVYLNGRELDLSGSEAANAAR